MEENRDLRQSVSEEETVPETKPEKKKKNNNKKKTSIIIKIWAALVVVLAFLAGSLIAQEHALHKSWEREEQEMYDSIKDSVTEMGSEAVQEHSAETDTDCLTASAGSN